jgi:secreted trypsin-like serine protease
MRDRFLPFLLLCFAVSCSSPTPPEPTGEASSAIIAGTGSGADQDSVVLLFRAGTTQTCTGTIVAPNLLVTARHCVGDVAGDGHVVDSDASDIRVFVGRSAFTTLSLHEDREATVGREIVVSPSTSLYPDIAFVVLEKALTVPVATMRVDRGVEVGESLRVVGYGIDESGERPLRRMQRDGLVVVLVGPGRSHIGEPLGRGELVFGEAACSGDSGGPAFSTTTGELVAVASRVGNGTAPRADAPAAFCTGDNADDVYTDFTPVSDLVTRAIAASEGRELPAATQVGGGSGTTTPGDATDKGCRTARGSRPSPSMLVLAFVAAFCVRRARFSRARNERVRR